MVLLDANRSLADVRAVCEQYEDVGMLMNPSTIVQHNFSRNVSTELNRYLSCGGQHIRQTLQILALTEIQVFKSATSIQCLSIPELTIGSGLTSRDW